MAIEDRYFKAERGPDGKRTGRMIRTEVTDKRWRLRWHGQDHSFSDSVRKNGPQPGDKPPRQVEIAWAKMLTAEPRKKVDEVTVAELLDRWLATKKGLSPRGYRACLDASAHVRREWGKRLASTIVAEEVQSWLAGLTWSPSMKHKLLQALSGALKLTGQPNPCDGVKTPRERRREARWLDVTELAKLAAECKGYESLIWTLGTTGLRIGEAVALNVGNVNTERGRLRVIKSKSGKARDVPVPSKVLAMFDLGRLPSEPLFTGLRGRRILPDNFRARFFTPAAERCGFDDLHIHDLRHVAASLAIANGAVPTDVATMLGHEDPSITLRIYTERWDKGLDDVARRMDGMIGGNDE